MKKTVLAILFLIGFFLATSFITTSSTSAGEEGNSKAQLHLGKYWQSVREPIVQCFICPHKCVLDLDQRGICTVRINKGGKLYTLGYGNPVAIHVDPIEKKPFFHVAPGEPIFSLAVAGCNMRCLFCQNWQISQSRPDETQNYSLSPEEVVQKAIENKCRFIAYTYTEPTVFYEYMLDISKLAREKGIKNTMHTCGYINPEPLRELLKYMDAVNVDLKGFSEEFYAKMGLSVELKPVLETLKIIKEEGVWLEITNLLIPGFNDDPQKIKEMCAWIRENLGDEVPLHFSRFMPSYKLMNLPPTPTEKLEEAYNIAKGVGLKYVYIGNVPGHQGENTYCPNCGKIVVKRMGYQLLENNIKDGKCEFCGYKIAGSWTYNR
ncbi:MAG: AmmeMemoRadiSam system radical SAM enzyme [Candidatus Omnitrophica bacterium CG07_land_8_20_14_0_80_42_15]|uniref:AmmeMemoRadiSam system radical SAM enzyme n=1 Tax=Candidatus Aquitaenariimonas noxiae TaxID=1974741 RepID=A0A2J0KYH7_9BACT|nr:MAG: AmmeMemoRadiSam system radical SAM enzyme [Candidatus Omnitrophica bacterium CG07_land_8_20_14_0_80_42_15]